ncbi:xanthine dehydrogenase accessory protein XdhC [Aquitalea magnusonii]|nr:xanthine dehydrogenase accessory protein XdhC [Aquitalea magnusonii]
MSRMEKERAMLLEGDWLTALRRQLPQQGQAMLVTVVRSQGQVPRETGARLALAEDWQADSLGGGWLEQQACSHARRLLAQPQVLRHCLCFQLGPAGEYCCAGKVWLLFEKLDRQDEPWLELAWQARREGRVLRRTLLLDSAAPVRCSWPAGSGEGVRWLAEPTVLQDDLAAPELTVVLCGAGHVGRAVSRLLGELPVRLIWLDNRPAMFPLACPEHVTTLLGGVELNRQLPADACWLVMTHSDLLDYCWIEQILQRADARFVGLLGSHSKLASFNLRLMGSLPLGRIASIRCPVGIAGIDSRQPAAVAIAVVAELLQLSGTPLPRPHSG